MADVKATPEKITPFDLTEKVTLYAPTGAKYHMAGQEVAIHPRQKEKFLKQGFSEVKPANVPAPETAALNAPPDPNGPKTMTEAGSVAGAAKDAK